MIKGSKMSEESKAKISAALKGKKKNIYKKKALSGLQSINEVTQTFVSKRLEEKDGIVTIGRKCINNVSTNKVPYKPRQTHEKHRWNIVIYETNVLKAVRILHEYGIEVSLELYNGK